MPADVTPARPLPPLVLDPPFDITRTSHVNLVVKDLAASRDFYMAVAGLVVTAEDKDHVYLRGVEEVCHHSLVLRRAEGPATCDYIGLRVRRETDLEKAKAHYDKSGLRASWVERPFQGRTLLVEDGARIPIDLCVHMPTQPRRITDYRSQEGGRALRIDHFQIVVPDVAAAGDAFINLGFRVSEYISHAETGELMGIFLHRKQNPHDVVFARGAGPRLHHFAYVVSDLQSMIRACDVAGSIGFGRDVERGPGRHGPGHGMFVYFRDPDGHRLELILPPMQIIDGEEEPRAWNSSQIKAIVPWGPSAPQRWVEEATHFTGVDLGDVKNFARWHST